MSSALMPPCMSVERLAPLKHSRAPHIEGRWPADVVVGLSRREKGMMCVTRVTSNSAPPWERGPGPLGNGAVSVKIP